MNVYGGADDAIRAMNRKNLKLFDGLRLMKKDELNVIRAVSEVYKKSARDARTRYYEIAVEAFIIACVQAHKTNAEATKWAEKYINLDWVDEMLEETDFVTLYRFDKETERKKQRMIEALSATQNWNDEIDKALRYWTLQVGQYAINVVDRARMEAFERAGVTKVKWNTEKDQRVCPVCHDLDGKVFKIKDAPGKMHWSCRCYYSIVFDS